MKTAEQRAEEWVSSKINLEELSVVQYRNLIRSVHLLLLEHESDVLEDVNLKLKGYIT